MRWLTAGLVVLLVSGCCRTCREQPAAPVSVVVAEVPAPYRLTYGPQPTRYIPGFVVIQGGREFILEPELPAEVRK